MATPGKTTVLEMGLWNSLPNKLMVKINQKKDCSFIIRFTYNRKKYEVYIPAGTQFDTTLDWYGPEKLISMFEYKELD